MNGQQFIVAFGPEYKKLTKFEKRRFLEGMLEYFNEDRSYEPGDWTLANSGALMAKKMRELQAKDPSPEASVAMETFRKRLEDQIRSMR